MDNREVEEYERAVREAEVQASQSRTQMMQQEGMFNPKEKNLADSQLDLEEEITKIYFLLKGWERKYDEEQEKVIWQKPDNPDLIVLSDYGVQLIMDTISWYLNKNTLLSNYDDKTILTKMEDFSNDLNDDLFMSYEKVFRYPTLEECKDEIRSRIKNKIELRKFANELVSKKVPEGEIEKEILKELEGRIERELEIIKAQKMKDKLKKFALLMRKIQDAIHSTYLRAWKGQERTTLRQHIHISETKGGIMQQPARGGGPLDFFRRR